jgi:hypothetical protein
MVPQIIENFDALIERKLKHRNNYALRPDHNPSTLQFYDQEIDQLEKIFNYIATIRKHARKTIDDNLRKAFEAGHQDQILKDNSGYSNTVFHYVTPKYI